MAKSNLRVNRLSQVLHFNAAGGGGNDIEVAVLDESEWPNWANGHEASLYYSSEGKKTTGSFDLTLRPGSYVLVFNNRFSSISSKFVGFRVDLNYQRQEPYPAWSLASFRLL